MQFTTCETRKYLKRLRELAEFLSHKYGVVKHRSRRNFPDGFCEMSLHLTSLCPDRRIDFWRVLRQSDSAIIYVQGVLGSLTPARRLPIETTPDSMMSTTPQPARIERRKSP